MILGFNNCPRKYLLFIEMLFLPHTLQSHMAYKQIDWMKFFKRLTDVILLIGDGSNVQKEKLTRDQFC